MKIKAQIVKIHRWFGLAMCVFFVTWFLSGFVMLYVDFPQFGTHDRLLQNSPLDIKAAHFSPSALTQLLPVDTAWKSIRMSLFLNRAVYRLEEIDGDIHTYYTDGSLFPREIAQSDAEAVAVNYLHHHYRPLLTEKITELDQWIPRSFYLIHMPVYRITMDDPAQTMVYVSSKTGEIIQAHNRRDRFLAWCGPIIHWIYPKELIIRRPLWKCVVIFLSCLGIAGSLSGMIIGFIRVKKRNKVYISPYTKRWFRWHHYTGFVFGFFTFTWVFSGLLTMSPFGWSPDAALSDKEYQKIQGGNLTIKSFAQPIGAAFSKIDFKPVEIELKHFNGVNYYIAYAVNGKTRIVQAEGKDRPLEYSFPAQIITAAMGRLTGNMAPSALNFIYQEDNYYYSKHNDSKLPVLRIEYDDPDKTWYYINPSSGAVVLKNTHSRRINRWLYHGLHSLDFFNFQHHRPLWDILIVLLLAGGTGVSITGLIMALKRISR